MPLEAVKDPADPQRCKGTHPEGQCIYKAEHGSDYCRAHGGRSTAAEEELKGYLLADLQAKARLAELSAPDPIKELRDAIKLNHILIERRFNMIKTDADLIAGCGQLDRMLQTMEKLIKSCHGIEQDLGALLAKQTVLQLAKRMVEIIICELQGIDNYEEIVDRITDQLFPAVLAAGNSHSASTVLQPRQLTSE